MRIFEDRDPYGVLNPRKRSIEWTGCGRQARSDVSFLFASAVRTFLNLEIEKIKLQIPIQIALQILHNPNPRHYVPLSEIGHIE